MDLAKRSNSALADWMNQRFESREAWWLTATAEFRMRDLEMAARTRRWLSSVAKRSQIHIEVLIAAGVQPKTGLLHFHMVAAALDGFVRDRDWLQPLGLRLDREPYDPRRAAIRYTLNHDDYEVAVWCPRRKRCRRTTCVVAPSGIPTAGELAGLASRARS